MTEEVKEETEVVEEEKKEEEDKLNPYDYSCEILLSKTTLENANDKKFPSDAYLVWYNIDGKEMLDLTRSSKQSNIFDMYYDKYKKELKRIEWGAGVVNPSMWGYKQSDKKKKKK